MPKRQATRTESGDFDPYHEWLGIPEDNRPPSHYQLLGISPKEEKQSVIESSAARQSGFVQEHVGGEHDQQAGQILFEIEEARITLLNPESRAKYDRSLKRGRKRRPKNARANGPTATVPPGGRPVGEGSEFVRSYLGIVGIILAAFIIMAVVAFRLPWNKPRVDAVDRPVNPNRGANGQAGGIQPKKPHPVVAAAPGINEDAPANADDDPPNTDPRIVSEPVLTMPGHEGVVWCVAFSGDGRRIVSSSTDMTVKVWNAESGDLEHTLAGHNGHVRAVAISPDGRRIVTGSQDKMLKLWDAANGKESATLTEGTRGINNVAFSSDGNRIISGGYDNTVKVWDVESGQRLLTLEARTRTVYGVAISPDGKWIASSGRKPTIKVWDADNGQEVQALTGHTRDVYRIAFSPDSRRLGSVSMDRTLKVWDVESGQELLTLKGHSRSVRSVAFSRDGRRIVSSSFDGTVRVWDAGSGREMITIKPESGYIYSAVFSPDGKRIVSGGADKVVKVWDVGS